MSLTLKPGTRLFSVVCTTELIVVKAGGDVELTIGGVEPVTAAGDRSTVGDVVAGHGGGAAIGKRYVDSAGTIELLVTKPGEGVPAVGEELLTIKDAKPLPASD